MTDFDFSKYKVLLCDTDPEVIDVARTTYLDAGIGDFVATPSPQEALTHLPSMKPDLILVALKFPKTTGVEVIQKMRSMNDGEFYKTPVLMLLDKVSQNLLREVCRAGIEGALRKPIGPDKVLRFTRAVILKPRRFICVRHYFGPERRSRDDPHFEGNRRSSFKAKELSTDEFTRNKPSTSAVKSSLESGTVLSKPTQPAGGSSSGGNVDLGTSSTKPSADGGAMDHSSGEPRGGSNGDYDLISGGASSTSKNVDNTYASKDKASAKSNDIDYGTSENNASVKNTDVEYGISKDRENTKEKTAGATSENKPSAVVTDIKTAQEETKEEEKIEAEPTGPDNDDYEEIMDLEECLELHKQWVNSGGKSGQQAKRPHSDFRGQELTEVDFTRSVLPQSNFEGVNCTSVVFRKSDLSGSTFKDALLSSADMRVSRLSKSDFRNAKMDKANFLGADLAGANLEGATMNGVNLSGANLHLTNLRGVNLASVQGLIPEQIKRAITDQTTQLPMNAQRTP